MKERFAQFRQSEGERIPLFVDDERLAAACVIPASVLAQEINLSTVFAGQTVGVTQVTNEIWLVSFMHYDLGYFNDETCRLEPIENRLGPKV